MTKNMGGVDRIVRILIGLVLPRVDESAWHLFK